MTVVLAKMVAALIVALDYLEVANFCILFILSPFFSAQDVKRERLCKDECIVWTVAVGTKFIFKDVSLGKKLMQWIQVLACYQRQWMPPRGDGNKDVDLD